MDVIRGSACVIQTPSGYPNAGKTPVSSRVQADALTASATVEHPKTLHEKFPWMPHVLPLFFHTPEAVGGESSLMDFQECIFLGFFLY